LFPFRFTVTETGPKRLAEVSLTHQLCLKAGEALETGRKRMTLGPSRIELGPEAIGATIRHHGWSLQVPVSSRLVWPVYPFDPYRDGPETDLKHAVGVLSVPVQPDQTIGPLGWRRQSLFFELTAP
jgi:hypothetical protein